VTLALLYRAPAPGDSKAPPTTAKVKPPSTRLRGRLPDWVLAVGVLLVAAVGTNVVFHRFLLADDEYSAWFQAVIFARGKWSATVAADWCPWIKNMTPTSVGIPAPCTWHLGFFPLHSMVRAGFFQLGADWLSGPVTAAASVLLIGVIARRLWPQKPRRAWVAMVVLATSTQLLFMSMTMFSMPTHLLFALIWLWLYVVDSQWSVVVLPWVGALALGVHSPFPHLLFAGVFILRYLRDRRFAVTLYVAAVYASTLVWWRDRLSEWSGSAGTLAAATNGVRAAAVGSWHIPDLVGIYAHTMSVTLIGTWNMPLMGVCVIAAAVSWSRLDTFSRDAVLSLILTVCLRGVMPPYMDGEGWGYRYVYANLGLLALVTAVGVEVLTVAMGSRRAVLLFAASAVAAVAIQLPMRAVQVRRVIDPYYRTSRFFAAQPESVVAFHAAQFLWARQLVRNDPFLRSRPIIMDLDQPNDPVTPPACERLAAGIPATDTPMSERATAMLRSICSVFRMSSPASRREAELLARFPGQVRIVRSDELAALGLTPFALRLDTAGRNR
jgi:hypothetical protein